MTYRITYAFDRDNIYTTLIQAKENADLLYWAKRYISEQHGVGSFKKLVAFSFLSQMENGT